MVTEESDEAVEEKSDNCLLDAEDADIPSGPGGNTSRMTPISHLAGLFC